MSNRPRQSKKDAKSFIATIRVDIRHLASIAAFLKSRNVFVETKGRVASEAIKLLASHTFTDFPVYKYEEAVVMLDEMGYGNAMGERDTSYYRALLGQVKLEIKTEKANAEYIRDAQPIVNELTKEARETKQAQTETKARTQDILNMTENMASSPVADLDQKSSDEAKRMMAGLGQIPTAEATEEGAEHDD